MAFRYLIYSTGTTYADTVVRESAINDPSVNEASLFTDFVIPVIQPLYLWRVTGGTTVVPNTDQNIENYLDVINPPSPDEPVDYQTFTGYTATTYGDITYISGITDNKLDKVTGATNGNIVIFSGGGSQVIDSGFSIADVLAMSGGTPIVLFTGYTATTEIRLEGIEDDIVYLSGVTSGNTESINDIYNELATITGVTSLAVTGVTQGGGGIIVDNTNPKNPIISLNGSIYLSATTFNNYTGVTQNQIDYISGVTSGNTQAIAELSGATDLKLDIVTFTGYTASTEIRLDDIEAVTDIAITGVTNGLTKVGLHGAKLGGTLTENTTIAGAGKDLSITGLDSLNISFSGVSTITDNGANGGLRYGGDYAAQYVDRSLVDKAYVDSIAQGLDLKESVKVATTTGETNIDLTGGTFGGVVDGYTLIDGDRVLIKNQDAAKQQNGIYIWDSGLNTFARAIDFVNPNVTTGAFMFVETGTTHAGSGWVLVTQDPISVGITPLTFTQFSEAGSFTAGVGIDINGNVISFDGAAVAGTWLQWNGTQLNVTGLTSQSDFNSFTADTNNNFAYISGITDQNTADILALSAITSGLTGTYVTVQEFTGYTATTEIRLDNIEADITYLSGVTSGNTQAIADIVNDIAYISGITDTKLDTNVFTGFTASTQSNEIFLAHTGGTNPNTILPTAIVWHTGITVGSHYQFTGGSNIRILTAGTYEITYNIPFNGGANVGLGIGSNLILNNVTVIDLSAAAGWTTRNGGAGQAALPSINYTFAANDKIDLVVFRTGQAGTATTKLTGSILIKKKNTLQ